MVDRQYIQKLLKSDPFIITDDLHIFGITKRGQIKDEFLRENYGQIAFSFDMLDRIKSVIQGLNFDGRIQDVDIRFLAPRGDLPLVIIARFPRTYSRSAHEDHPDDLAIILAPRMEEGCVVYPQLEENDSPKDWVC